MSVSSIPNEVKSSTNRKAGESFISRCLTNNLNEMKRGELWRAAVAEYLGTFLLVFFGVAVGMRDEDEAPVPLLTIAIGCAFVIGVIISALSTVSGGHINPAISIGFLVSNQITLIRFLVYSIFQMCGSISAVALLQEIMPTSYHGNLGLLLPAREVTDAQAVAMEMIITGTLIFVTLAMVDKHRQDVAGSIPLMVGLIVGVNILASGNMSGGCMNPARALGPAAIVQNMDRHWIYWLGPLSGAAVAGWLYDNVFSTRPLSIIARCVRTDEHTYSNAEEEEAEIHLNDVHHS